jgi:serine/threonine-protein kinase RsbW
MEPGHYFSVTLSLEQDRLQLELTDSGAPLSTAVCETLKHGSTALDYDETDIANLPEGGLGLEIIRRSVDGIEYFPGEENNRLLMTVLVSRGR